MCHPRQCLALLTVAVAAVFVLLLSNNPQLLRRPRDPLGSKRPDFSRYRHIQVLSSDDFPTDNPRRRVILLGDIHGMEKPLTRLLTKVAYDSQNDVLVHTGDVLSRGPHKGSMRLLEFLTTHNITGVRGNHDQKVIEWKGWLDWFITLPGGVEWMAELESTWLTDKRKGLKLKAWVKSLRKASRGEEAKWWDHIPHKWIPFSDHYRIARDLTEEQYEYLVSLPLKLHIPSAHTFVIHAGLLPYDVRYDYDDDERQPLARVPRIPSRNASSGDERIQMLRHLQELLILRQVPQNTDPWVNLNMRSVLKSKEISKKSHKGTPWTTYWNKQMDMCDGFHPGNVAFRMQEPDLLSTSDKADKSLPCHPASVIHGHAASRDLDIDRYSFGLDTGCVYGRKLTALILGPNPLPYKEDWEEEQGDFPTEVDEDFTEADWHDLDDDDYELPELENNLTDEDTYSPKRSRTVKFGEHGTATLVQVSCP